MQYKKLRKSFDRIPIILRWIYDCVEVGLWACLIAWILFMVVFWLPKLPKIRAEIARVRVEEIAAENRAYCEKLGMKSGARSFDECLLTLGDFRLKVKKRIEDETSW